MKILYTRSQSDLIGDSIIIKHRNNRYYQEIKTKRGKIVQEEFEVIDSCNEAINYLRNSIVFDPIYSSINDTSRKYIGYGNYQMAQTISSEKYTVCPFEFKKIAADYEKNSYAKIQSIYAKKLNRHKWFIEHIDSVDIPIIIDFMTSFHNCKPDAEILNLILINKPLPFLKACDKIVPDYYMLGNLPKEIRWANAIAQIEAQAFTPKKYQIVRALKKNL